MKKLILLLSLCLLPVLACAQKTLPKGWYNTQYYSSIDNVWDASVLPECLPGPPEGVKVEETMYKSTQQKSMGNKRVGDISFENDNYEKYAVNFVCTNAQFDAYVNSLKNAGFLGYKENDSPITYTFAGNGYYIFFEFRNFVPRNDGYDGTAQLVMTPDVYEKPATFCGFPLPQVGMLNYDVINNNYLHIYTDDDEKEIPYDSKNDPGIANEVGNNQFFIAFDLYMGVSEKEARDYFASLENSGFKRMYPMSDTESSITARYQPKNGGMVIGVRYSKTNYCIEVQAAKIDDYLFN